MATATDHVEAHDGADSADDAEGGEDAEDDADEAVQAPLQAAALAGHPGRVHHYLDNTTIGFEKVFIICQIRHHAHHTRKA